MLFLTAAAQDKWDAFSVAYQQLVGAHQCPACNQFGHYPWDCATTHGANKLAQHHGVSWEWGALKGAIYYGAWE